MKSERGSIFEDILADKVAQGEGADRIAEVLMQAWQRVDAVLTPLIGHRGVAALYQRSMQVTANTIPWLAVCYQGIQQEMQLDLLQEALARQSSADAAIASAELFRTFHNLLASLIGPSLTARLLLSVWTTSSSGASAQD
jgi:hypothetical protein